MGSEGAPAAPVLGSALVGELLAVGTRETVLGGSLLFAAGDPGDSLYVVESGRLRVFGTVDGVEVTVRLLGPGDVVGELALVCGAPRAASVRAVRDTTLVRVSDEAFQRLLRADTGFAAALVAALGEKLRSRAFALPPPSVARPKVVAVVALDESGIVPELAAALAGAIGAGACTSGPEPGSGEDERAWSARLDGMEARNDVVVLVGARTGRGDAWTAFCERQADRVLGVVGGPPGRVGVPEPGLDLVLCGRGAAHLAARAWIARVRPRAHHRVPDPAAPGAADRLARRTTGTSRGVVLSGGGARGLAHLGVLEVLGEAGVTFDRFGGTSMGALVAALAASGRPSRSAIGGLRSELVDRRPFRDFTVPRTALLRARRARAMLERLLGPGSIEDLELDCFTVSADLGSAEVVVQRRGPVVEAVGASMSLPGLAPPVRVGARFLVDGGVLNNVPVDVMAETGEGPVLAIDVMSRVPIGAPSARLPSIIETLARATVLGSHHQAEERLAAAEAVIAPELTSVGLLDFAKFDAIVEAGRRAAREALDAGLAARL
jgi:predicted acylesterase/phospholipase RssA